MGIKETIRAWVQQKDLSLILEIEPTPRVACQQNLPGFSDPPAIDQAILQQNSLFYLRHLEMLERNFGGKYLVIINGNETSDGKTRFYVDPAIRGKTGNLTWDELRALYPNANPQHFYISKDNPGRIYAAV